MEFELDVSMSPWSGHWIQEKKDYFFDHQKRKDGIGGHPEADELYNKIYTDYACPWDAAKSKCSVKCNPMSPEDIYDLAAYGTRNAVKRPERMWSRTELQWKPPRAVNSIVGDRFFYLVGSVYADNGVGSISFVGIGHKWWNRITPLALAKKIGCVADGDIGVYQDDF